MILGVIALFILIDYYSRMLAPTVGPRPESHPSLMVTLYLTALASLVLVPAMILAAKLFELEKEKIQPEYLKYLAIGLVFVLLISFTAISFYNTQEYTPPPTYFCELEVTNNSTCWVINVTNSALPEDGIIYVLERGESHNLLEFGNPLDITADAPSGYNISFFDADNDSHITSGDFFTIQKSGGIKGTAESGDFFYLELRGEGFSLNYPVRLP